MQTIENILKALSDTVLTTINAANDRASQAEAQYYELTQRLNAIIPAADQPKTVKPANLIKAKPTPLPAIEPDRLPAVIKSIGDSALISLLTTDWQTAGQLHKRALASGESLSLGSVYNRMRRLAEERPEIESAEMPARWRLRAQTVPSRRGRRLKTGGAIITASSSRKGKPVSASLNDNEQATIIHGDCLDVMRQMATGSIDLIVTSPPYNLGVSTGGGLRGAGSSGRWRGAALANGYASYDDARDPAEYVEWQKEVLRECWRLLADDGAIYYNHQPRIQAGQLQTPLDLNPDLPVRQIVIWDRNSGFNFNDSFYLPRHEWLTIFAKPAFRLTQGANKLTDVWSIPPARDNDHPAPFPVELAQRAIESTSARVVLDPFAGSGTTGVAALKLGRKFIGIELDGSYCESARARIAGADKPQSRKSLSAMIGLHHGDTFEVMADIPDGSINLICADLPYGVTGSSWDKALDPEALWREYRRVITKDGVIALFGTQPFITAMAAPATALLKHSIIWEKTRATGHLQAANMPMRNHEEILLFSPAGIGRADRCGVRMKYNPVGMIEDGVRESKPLLMPYLGGIQKFPDRKLIPKRSNFPRSIWRYPKDSGKYHSAQKPVALLERLIECFSDAGDVVLDNTMGSGSAGVAALRTGRRFIGIEKERKFFEIATSRFKDADLRKVA